MLPKPPPCDDIGIRKTMGFQCALQRMQQEGQALGTNVIYLNDYWETVSSPIVTCPDAKNTPYVCKGDYFIREDLGGMESLKAAIDKVHQTLDANGAPGRVILYLEPFLVHKNSAVGNAHGELWGGRFTGGGVWFPFSDGIGIAMSQANGEWQQYVVQKAADLVRQTGADGIFLDSAGWRLGLPVETKQEVVLNSPLENAMGVLNLADRVRTVIQAVSPNHDAVVLSENTAGPMWRHVDGGVSADFNPSAQGGFTGVDALGGSLLTSPIRYALPQINVFSNGTNLNELNQVFAVGHNLALCTNYGSTWIQTNAAYIHTLVQARRDLASALVHGAQIYQLDVQGDQGGDVVVYSYTGSPDVVNVLNAGATAFSGTIPVHALMQPGTRWRDRLNGDLFTVTPAGLPITVPAVPPVAPQCSDPNRWVGCTQQCGATGRCGLRVLEENVFGDP